MYSADSSNFLYSGKILANSFGCTESNIRHHKANHSDVIVKNIDFVSVKNSHSKYEIFYSKSGAVKMADFVGTPKAKQFISQFTEKAISKMETVQPATQPNSFDIMQMLLDQLKSQNEAITQVQNDIQEIKQSRLAIETVVNSAPQKTTRQLLVQTVNRIADQFDLSEQEVWRKLYIELQYRPVLDGHGIHAKTRAKTLGISKIELLEKMELLDSAYSVLVDIFATVKI